MKRSPFYASFLLMSTLLFNPALFAQKNTVTVNWNKTLSVSKTTPTLQVVVNPMLKNGSPIYKQSFAALKALGADYVRFVPWFPYPRVAVAEIKAPTKTQTFWDFKHADPYVKSFMDATAGHDVVMNFSTTPAWMWKTDKPLKVPESPDQVFWDYNPGTELRDTTMKEVSGYFARLFSWYTKGGFTDELGKFHKSGYAYKFPYWEVLNEPDLEHNISPQVYTKMYDAIVTEIRKVAPETKFTGISVAYEHNPEWFEYFLNTANHKAGIPMDAISYHFYGSPTSPVQELDSYQYSFFDQANGFLDRVRYIENIRKRLSPNTKTQINEIGTIIKGRNDNSPIPKEYWNLSGAMYAYIFLELSKIGIDVAGESQLVGYPSQFPDVSMMNWINGKPNARFWVLKLLKDNLGAGDKLLGTNISTADISAQGYITAKGKKCLLLINKRNKEIQLDLPAGAATVNYVDVSTGDNPGAEMKISSNAISVKPYMVALISYPLNKP